MANEIRMIDTANFINDLHHYDEQQKNDKWTTADIEFLLSEQPTVDAVPLEQYNELKERYKRLLETADILDTALREYQRKYGDLEGE